MSTDEVIVEDQNGNRLNGRGIDSITSAVVMLIFGVVLIIWNGVALEIAVRILGTVLVIGGVSIAVSWVLKDRETRSVVSLPLYGAVILVIMGIVFLATPGILIAPFPIVIGALIAVNGVVNLILALELGRSGSSNWGVSAILAVLSIILGIVICTRPFKTIDTLLIMIGIVLVYNALLTLGVGIARRRLL